jgi:hypothetical protein
VPILFDGKGVRTRVHLFPKKLNEVASIIFELLRPLESDPAFRQPRILRERAPAFRTMPLSFKFLRTSELCLEKSRVQVQRTRGHGRLSNLNEVPIRVAHVAPQFRCVNLRLSNEVRAPRRPKVVAAHDIRHAQVQKDA